MRILFYLHNLKIGGCQVNAVSLAIALKDLGHDIFVLSDSGQLIDRLNNSGIKHIQINQGVRHFSIKNALVIAKLVKSLKIDVVQAFDPIFIVEAHTSRLVHNRPTLGMVTAQRKPVFSLPRITPTIFVNPSILEYYIVNYNWRRENTFLLKERLDLNLYKPLPSHLHFYLTPEHKSKKIVSLVSRLDKDKAQSVNLFLQLAKYVFNHKIGELFVFYIVGSGPLLDFFHEEVIKLGLEDKVYLTGEIYEVNLVLNSSFVVVAMASTCQQSLAVGKPTFVIGELGFLKLVKRENFDELSYYHFNVHNQSTENVEEYFYNSLEELIGAEDAKNSNMEFADFVGKTFSSSVGAMKLESLYKKIVSESYLKSSRFNDLSQVTLSYISYFKYLIKRKVNVWDNW